MYVILFLLRQKMKRLCFFSHFDRDAIVDDYVICYLEGLKTVADCIIFISNSGLSRKEQEKLSDIAENVIVRENTGYDFGSWKEGLERFGFENLEEYDEIILANDSCYGPLYPFSEMFDKMAGKNCDFWGVTKNNAIFPHVQSFFLVFRKAVFNSAVFRAFWQKVVPLKGKYEMVDTYEVGLSEILTKQGFCSLSHITFGRFRTFVCSVRHKYFRIRSMLLSQKGREAVVIRDFQGNKRSFTFSETLRRVFYFVFHFSSFNPMITEPLHCLKNRCPLIKTELFKHNFLMIDTGKLVRQIEKTSAYDMNLISSHAKRTMFSPFTAKP